jgi:small-conductance mechanosensitive channel/CRP-like cAMP-binding protein
MPDLFSSKHSLLLEIAFVPLIFTVLLIGGRWLKRDHGVRLGLGYLIFSLALAVWTPLHLFEFGMSAHTIEALKRHTAAAAIVFGSLFVIGLVRRFFWELWFERRQGSKAPKFLSQVVALLVFVGALLAALGGIYGVSIQGAVLGSTVVVGVVGFAMQDLLGNIIAGIAIEIGKPFRTGDWLIADGKHMEVMEVNWRSTRCRDNDNIYYDIPNRHIVGTTITNLTSPDRVHGIRIRVGFEYNTPPNQVKDCLKHAALTAEGVLAEPEPRVFLADYGDSAIIYEIRFWMEDESRYNPICDAVRTNIWYEAQRAGLKIPFPIRTLQIERRKKEDRTALETAHTCLRRQPFLQLLSPSQLDRLLADARLLRFGRGEHIIEQGAEGRSMFVLVHGQAEVYVTVGGAEKHVATLRDGDYCGEMSLLTGEVRTATVQARTDCEMWEIGKDTLGDILAENQGLLEKLSEILAKRKMEVDGIIEASMSEHEKTQTVARYKEGFLQRLYGFFEL